MTTTATSDHHLLPPMLLYVVYCLRSGGGALSLTFSEHPIDAEELTRTTLSSTAHHRPQAVATAMNAVDQHNCGNRISALASCQSLECPNIYLSVPP